MAFRFQATFSITGKTFEYQWATTPSDTQIKEIINDMVDLFRYKKEFIKAIIKLRDNGYTKYVPWDKSFELVITS